MLVFFMNKKEAARNLKATGWVLVAVGIMALLSVVWFWKESNIVDSVFDICFGVAMLYFGFLILSSMKAIVSA